MSDFPRSDEDIHLDAPAGSTPSSDDSFMLDSYWETPEVASPARPVGQRVVAALLFIPRQMVWHFIERPWQHVRRVVWPKWFPDGLNRIAFWLHLLLLPLVLIVDLALLPIRWVMDAGSVARRQHLWPALPAAFAAVAAGGVAALSMGDMLGRLERTYQDAALDAAKRGKIDDARLCWERLAALDGGKPNTLFALALAKLNLGDLARAITMIAKLAPDDRLGYGPAHLWQADQILRSASGMSDARLRGLAESHLERCATVTTQLTEPQRQEMLWLLAQVRLAQNKTDAALPLLEKLAPERLEARLVLGNVLSRQNQPAAREQYSILLEQAKARLVRNPNDLVTRNLGAEAARRLGDYPGAEALLRDGVRLTNDPQTHQSLANLYLVWLDRDVPADSAAALGRRLKLLRQAIEAQPTNVAALRHLAELTRGMGTTADAARATLQQLLAAGQHLDLLHLVLGDDAWQRGDHIGARRHYEQAFQISPAAPAIANNLAYALASQDAKELPRALALIDGVLAVTHTDHPQRANFRETRGQILVRLGRYKEALGDLEAALVALPTRRDLHLALANAYDKLGDPDMAKAHRDKAKVK